MRDNDFAMRNKTIISTAAFIIAFVFSAAFASLFIDKTEYQEYQLDVNFDRKPTSCFKHSGNYTADKIEAFLKQDDRNGRTLDSKLSQIYKGFRSPFASSSFPEYAESVSDYADKSGNMDTDNLPQEFQIAWREHMKAWRNYADFLDSMKNSSARRKIDEEKLVGFENEYNADINRTWYKVLRVSKEYGADFN